MKIYKFDYKMLDKTKLPEAMSFLEIAMIEEALKEYKQIKGAAIHLGLNRTTLLAKLNKYGLREWARKLVCRDSIVD